MVALTPGCQQRGRAYKVVLQSANLINFHIMAKFSAISLITQINSLSLKLD